MDICNVSQENGFSFVWVINVDVNVQYNVVVYIDKNGLMEITCTTEDQRSCLSPIDIKIAIWYSIIWFFLKCWLIFCENIWIIWLNLKKA